MNIGIISLFPEVFQALDVGLIGKAKSSGAYQLYIENLRDHGEGAHKTVDDSPYGGGDGMILKAEVLASATDALIKKMSDSGLKPHVCLLSPKGRLFHQDQIQPLVERQSLIFVCGRYGGFDERYIESYCDEVLSIGDYVLCGGEVPALVLIECLVRTLPGVLGNKESKNEDSFSGRDHQNLLEAPSYTKPQVWREQEVPEVLTSGHHKNIEAYRKSESLRLTRLRRPELLDD